MSLKRFMTLTMAKSIQPDSDERWTMTEDGQVHPDPEGELLVIKEDQTTEEDRDFNLDAEEWKNED